MTLAEIQGFYNTGISFLFTNTGPSVPGSQIKYLSSLWRTVSSVVAHSSDSTEYLAVYSGKAGKCLINCYVPFHVQFKKSVWGLKRFGR